MLEYSITEVDVKILCPNHYLLVLQRVEINSDVHLKG